MSAAFNVIATLIAKPGQQATLETLLRGLLEQRIGVETMDTPAACRTYNILAGEGRRVVVALLLET